ncbi:MAG: hypothetical protein WBG10_09795 [Pseudolabrys sp.]
MRKIATSQHATSAGRVRENGPASALNTYFGLESARMYSRGYELSEQPMDFIGALTHRLVTLRNADISAPRVLCPHCGNKMRLAILEPHPRASSRKETTTFTCACGERFS